MQARAAAKGEIEIVRSAVTSCQVPLAAPAARGGKGAFEIPILSFGLQADGQLDVSTSGTWSKAFRKDNLSCASRCLVGKSFLFRRVTLITQSSACRALLKSLPPTRRWSQI